MAATTETRTFNNLYTATHNSWVDEGKATPQLLTSNPLVDALWKRGNSMVLDGGARITGAVRYGYNPNAQWYGGADPLKMDPFQNLTRYAYDWKMLHAPVVYTGEEVRKNRGKAQMINLVVELEDTTMQTLMKIIDISMAADGTADNFKSILGLDAFFPTDPTTDPAAGAIGDIPAATNIWWQNYSHTGFGSFAANGPGGASGDLWLSDWNAVSDGSGNEPDMVISAQNVFEFYHRANLIASEVVMSETANGTGDRSFATLKYRGKPWFWSRNIPDGRAYLPRLADLLFIVHPEAQMTLSEFQQAWNQDLFGAHNITQAAFITKRRMFSSVIDGITA
jgi:hypothetical protein